jgi:outer membrane protein OmpA-like peptidoglycan-associated protein
VPGVQRLVQFSFGTRAAFGVCVEPACPAVTPKTLSMAGAAPMQAIAHRVAANANAPHESGLQTEMAPVPSPAPSTPVQAVDTAIRNVVVVFPFASAGLTMQARTALSASIRHARQLDRIVISGRTDAVGDDQVNESLALARAMSVRNYLRDLAPDPAAAVISIDARGRCCFVAPNETEEGRSRKRRVEVAFFSQGGG